MSLASEGFLMTDIERFKSKVRYDPLTGCLLWAGGVF